MLWRNMVGRGWRPEKWPRQWLIPQQPTGGKRGLVGFSVGIATRTLLLTTRPPRLERLRIQAGEFHLCRATRGEGSFVAYDCGHWALDEVHMQHAQAPSHEAVMVDRRLATNTTFSQAMRCITVRDSSRRSSSSSSNNKRLYAAWTRWMMAGEHDRLAR